MWHWLWRGGGRCGEGEETPLGSARFVPLPKGSRINSVLDQVSPVIFQGMCRPSLGIRALLAEPFGVVWSGVGWGIVAHKWPVGRGNPDRYTI